MSVSQSQCVFLWWAMMTTASDLLTMQARLQINSWVVQCEPSDAARGCSKVWGRTREPKSHSCFKPKTVCFSFVFLKSNRNKLRLDKCAIFCATLAAYCRAQPSSVWLQRLIGHAGCSLLGYEGVSHLRRSYFCSFWNISTMTHHSASFPQSLTVTKLLSVHTKPRSKGCT